MKTDKLQISNQSTLKEIYKNPVGHDILQKLFLQMNLKKSWLENPLIQHLKLGWIRKILGKKVSADFFEALIGLLNQETKGYQQDVKSTEQRQWWKEAVFYQIYPRSFKDSNGDGIGDLGGILEQLDYLNNLGVDAIWLSPIYDSPNDDNGYDIRDYKKIMEEFGTMEEFDLLLQRIHEKGMRLIMDLVVNHTSDEHPWFQEALHKKDSKYRKYYFFKEEPNNWTSFFGGSAWNYYEDANLYGLHLFSSKQMDLNWENENLRQDMIEMIRWWLEKGVDGFRMDVINYISKIPGLPDGDETIGKLMGYYGIEQYFYGPKLHHYLREIKEQAFQPFHAFSVGEMPGIGQEMGKLLTGADRGELDMFFSFDHLENPGKVRFDPYFYDLNYLKEYLIDWNQNFAKDCSFSLFYNNHDNPRFISKVTNQGNYQPVIAKLLSIIQLTQKGTPFLYQGDELGMTNHQFLKISDFRDVESLNLYEQLRNEMTDVEILDILNAGSRDQGRCVMIWDNSIYGGFSNKEPWIWPTGRNMVKPASEQMEEEDSVFQFYKNLLRFRKENACIHYGETRFYGEKKKDQFAYTRHDNQVTYYIHCNLSEKEVPFKPYVSCDSLLISNYREIESFVLKPYEGRIYQRTEK